MWRYLGPVLLFSILFNVSKFFELKVTTTKEGIQTHICLYLAFIIHLLMLWIIYSGTYGYDFTPLRTNPTYSAVTNWLRLIFLGALPLSIIIYFNVKVYQDVKERSSRNAKRKCEKILRNVKVSAYFLCLISFALP